MNNVKGFVLRLFGLKSYPIVETGVRERIDAYFILDNADDDFRNDETDYYADHQKRYPKSDKCVGPVFL